LLTHSNSCPVIMKYHLLLKHLLILIFVITNISINIKAQGLLFNGNSRPIGQRTSYNVFDKNHLPAFSNLIDISFDLRISQNRTFGYLLHLVNNKTGEAFSLTYGYIDDNNSVFKFNTEGQENHTTITLPYTYIQQWIPIKLHINLVSGENVLSIGKCMKKGSKLQGLSSKIHFFLNFGRREHLIDVPEFAIRNLKISDNEHSYSFPLNESQGEKVHDDKGKIKGSASYPYWLIKDSYYWKKLASFITPVSIGSKFNFQRQELEFVTPKYFLTYNVNTKKSIKRNYNNSLPVDMHLGTTCLNEKRNEIYAYEINNLPIGDTTIGALNLTTLKWKTIGKAYTPTQLHHHVGFWDNTKTKYIVYGGFGSERYSDQFRIYNNNTDNWDILNFKGDKITPRFYSSITSVNNGNYFYLYGGVGNDSGDQNIGHNYYNDLYGIDLTNHIIKKYWSIPLKENRVPSETMVLSEDRKYLYVIRYAEYIKPTYLKLYKISIKDGSMQQLGDSIPFASGSIKSTVALYDNPQKGELYCITHEFNEKANLVNTNIFSLSTPPVSKSKIDYYSYKSTTYLFPILIFICACASFIIIVIHTKKKKGNKDISTKQPQTLNDIRHKTVPNTEIDKLRDIPKKNNNVYIYGRFTIYDRNGRDITYLFGKKLKLIFQYILLNSTENKTGVNSSLLNELFWPDKTEEKAKNIKGVSLSNLRKILSELDGIRLIYEKGIFKIKIDPDFCYCDYFYMHTQLALYPQQFESLLPIWERGKILEDIEDPLFDKYKEESEEIIFSILPNNVPVYFENNRFRDVLRICSIILKRDPINELALSFSIYSYKKLNEYENVLKVYSSFVIEYRKSMGKDYTKTIESILKEMK
jgi:two-component SAPR family response regulator